ncbi:MAG TPA: hypothetical protein PK916_18005, partial [Bacteroidota bacterium]|nr:hypothetical protein [Bacteroidota bacterium]
MILCCLLAHEAVGQKEWKDPYISIAKGHQQKPSVAQPSRAGDVVTVWEDERHHATLGSDIYIQEFDAGTGIPRWIGPRAYIPGKGHLDVVTNRFDGIVVCNAPGDQRNPRAAYDGMGGVIIVWEDYRDDPTNTVANIFAQRFELSTGRPDPGWPVNGIPICQTGAHAERPRIVGTSDGAFITWIDHRNNPGSPFQDRDVYLQYIKSATASWPPPPTNWQPDGISVAVFREPDQINPEIDVDNMPGPDMLGGNTQGVVVTYQDTRRMAPGGPQLWSVMANHISSDGVQLYMPPYDLTVTGNAPGSQEYPRVVTTGKEPWVQDRRAVIVWQDHANNPMGNTPDIHAQAFDPWGNALFNPTGAVVCNAPGAQILPRLTLWEHIDPVTQSYIPYVTVGWEDGRDAAATGVDIYAGLLDAQGPGIMVNPQGTSGDPITQDPNDQDQLAMDNVIVNSSVNEYTVFAWRHFTGTEWNIHYQEVNLPAWVYQQQLNGWPVTEAKGDQVQPQCARRVFVWQDGRRQSIPNDAQEDDNIYCQTPGECTGSTMMKWRDEWAMWTHGEDAANFRSVSDPSDGSTFVVWDEVRYGFGIPGPPCRIVFIQKFDRYGVPRWSNNGVAVNVFWAPDPWGSLTAQRADVCIDGAGGARVVWEQEVIA